MTTPRYSLGAKLFVAVCRSRQQRISGSVDTYLYLFESYWRQTLVSLQREICHYLHQPSTWGNQRGELTTLHHLFISIYSLIIHLEISIHNISLVLSCEPHPKCKPRATDNYIKELCVRYKILAPASTSTIVFSLVATTHPLVSCLCHSK